MTQTDNTHKVASGYLRFVTMPCSEKNEMAGKAKPCLSCRDTDYNYGDNEARITSRTVRILVEMLIKALEEILLLEGPDPGWVRRA